MPTVHLFGLDFVDLPGIDPLIEPLSEHVPRVHQDDPLPVVVTPNVDQIVQRDRERSVEANRLTDRSCLILPDGQPIVWASKALRRPLTARLAGSDLVPPLWTTLMEAGAPTLVIASAERTAERVRSDGPTAHALVAPMLSVDRPDEITAFGAVCADAILAGRPTHVFVTLGFPKQDLVIAATIDALAARDEPLPLFLAVGQSFEMHYGIVPRAPHWMQRVGLEWFHRFLREPRRLFRRYFVDDPAFLAIVWRERRR